MTWTAEHLTFDPLTHTSWLPDGTDVPHVTTVLGAVGVSTDFEALAAALGDRIEAAIRMKARLGQVVHADCHAYDDDDLNEATVHEESRPYLSAWAQLRADKGLTPLARERRVFHPLHVYTGALDGLFRCEPTGKIVLIDIKLGDPEDAAAHLQTAAYEAAHDAFIKPDGKYDYSRRGYAIDERWAAWLRPDLVRVPYRIVNYTARQDAWADAGKFFACLTAYNEQPHRRRRAA